MFGFFDYFSAANDFIQDRNGDFFDKAARLLIVTQYCLGFLQFLMEIGPSSTSVKDPV